jgi:hypothetical protein
MQSTLLTVHKGVDLHAATAVRVLRDRIEGGARLVRLARAECHTFWSSPEAAAERAAALLEIGRIFNPNKHRYGRFALSGSAARRPDDADGGSALPEAWPGEPVASDLSVAADLYDLLLGGRADRARGELAIDVHAWPLEQNEEPSSGLVWRLVLRPEEDDPRRLAQQLIVTRSRRAGLLVNPHMESWRWIVRR